MAQKAGNGAEKGIGTKLKFSHNRCTHIDIRPSLYYDIAIQI